MKTGPRPRIFFLFLFSIFVFHSPPAAFSSWWDKPFSLEDPAFEDGYAAHMDDQSRLCSLVETQETGGTPSLKFSCTDGSVAEKALPAGWPVAGVTGDDVSFALFGTKACFTFPHKMAGGNSTYKVTCVNHYGASGEGKGMAETIFPHPAYKARPVMYRNQVCLVYKEDPVLESRVLISCSRTDQPEGPVFSTPAALPPTQRLKLLSFSAIVRYDQLCLGYVGESGEKTPQAYLGCGPLDDWANFKTPRIIFEKSPISLTSPLTMAARGNAFCMVMDGQISCTDQEPYAAGMPAPRPVAVQTAGTAGKSLPLRVHHLFTQGSLWCLEYSTGTSGFHSSVFQLPYDPAAMNWIKVRDKRILQPKNAGDNLIFVSASSLKKWEVAIMEQVKGLPTEGEGLRAVFDYNVDEKLDFSGLVNQNLLVYRFFHENQSTLRQFKHPMLQVQEELSGGGNKSPAMITCTETPQLDPFPLVRELKEVANQKILAMASPPRLCAGNFLKADRVQGEKCCEGLEEDLKTGKCLPSPFTFNPFPDSYGEPLLGSAGSVDPNTCQIQWDPEFKLHQRIHEERWDAYTDVYTKLDELGWHSRHGLNSRLSLLAHYRENSWYWATIQYLLRLSRVQRAVQENASGTGPLATLGLGEEQRIASEYYQKLLEAYQWTEVNGFFWRAIVAGEKEYLDCLVGRCGRHAMTFWNKWSPQEPAQGLVDPPTTYFDLHQRNESNQGSFVWRKEAQDPFGSESDFLSNLGFTPAIPEDYRLNNPEHKKTSLEFFSRIHFYTTRASPCSPWAASCSASEERAYLPHFMGFPPFMPPLYYAPGKRQVPHDMRDLNDKSIADARKLRDLYRSSSQCFYGKYNEQKANTPVEPGIEGLVMEGADHAKRAQEKAGDIIRKKFLQHISKIPSPEYKAILNKELMGAFEYKKFIPVNAKDNEKKFLDIKKYQSKEFQKQNLKYAAVPGYRFFHEDKEKRDHLMNQIVLVNIKNAPKTLEAAPSLAQNPSPSAIKYLSPEEAFGNGRAGTRETTAGVSPAPVTATNSLVSLKKIYEAYLQNKKNYRPQIDDPLFVLHSKHYLSELIPFVLDPPPKDPANPPPPPDPNILMAVKMGFVDFSVPGNWQCVQKQKTLHCKLGGEENPGQGLLMVTIKDRGELDNFEDFARFLNTKKVYSVNASPSTISVVQYVRPVQIANQKWLSSYHVGSEIPTYHTRYQVTLGKEKVLMISLTAPEGEFRELNEGMFERLLGGLTLTGPY